MKTLDKVLHPVNLKFGAPLGQSNIFPQKYSVVDTGHKFLVVGDKSQRIYDCAVPMTSDGAYSKNGVYWGIGKQLRVEYTKDLTYVRFYRKN